MSFRSNKYFRSKSVLEYHETETQTEFYLTNGNVCKQKHVPSMQADVLWNKDSEEVILNDSVILKTKSFERDDEVVNKVSDIEVNPKLVSSVSNGQAQSNLDKRP